MWQGNGCGSIAVYVCVWQGNMNVAGQWGRGCIAGNVAGQWGRDSRAGNAMCSRGMGVWHYSRAMGRGSMAMSKRM